MSNPPLTHFDEQGQPHIVGIGDKPATRRVAVAAGEIRLSSAALAAIESGGTRKGDVLEVARLAGLMGAKRTADLIPLCHPLSLTAAAVEVTADHQLPGVRVIATVETHGRTGVEMEALTAVSCALLTVYDMCKSVDRSMEIQSVRLLRKEGGRSGVWEATPAADV